MIQRGFWPGSAAGFGLRRMLISADGKRKQFLKEGESKNLKSDRVILVPGPADEINCIHEIYRMFIKGKKSCPAIAKVLNGKNVRNGTRLWNGQSVRKVLTHEKYIGLLMWGRWTKKLGTRCIPTARQDWVVLPAAIQPVVDRKTFDAAQRRLKQRTVHLSNEDVLKKVRVLLKRKGTLSTTMLDRSRTTPGARTYKTRFGSLSNLYSLLGFTQTKSPEKRKQTRRLIAGFHVETFKRLKKLFPDIRLVQRARTPKPKNFCFSTGLKVSMVVCRSEWTCLGSQRWRFQGFGAKRLGVPTLLCLCNSKNTRIQYFYAMPTVSHIKMVSLLKRDDIRLTTGVRLNRLSDFRKVVHSFRASH